MDCSILHLQRPRGQAMLDRRFSSQWYSCCCPEGYYENCLCHRGTRKAPSTLRGKMGV
jgi:hypothetical protein